MATLVFPNRAEGYNLPQGVISQLYRAIAAKKPGVITRTPVGLTDVVEEGDDAEPLDDRLVAGVEAADRG